MTGKMTIPITLTKADYDILKLLDKNCFLLMDIKFSTGNMILLDVSAFTNASDALKREEDENV